MSWDGAPRGLDSCTPHSWEAGAGSGDHDQGPGMPRTCGAPLHCGRAGAGSGRRHRQQGQGAEGAAQGLGETHHVVWEPAHFPREVDAEQMRVHFRRVREEMEQRRAAAGRPLGRPCAQGSVGSGGGDLRTDPPRHPGGGGATDHVGRGSAPVGRWGARDSRVEPPFESPLVAAGGRRGEAGGGQSPGPGRGFPTASRGARTHGGRGASR